MRRNVAFATIYTLTLAAVTLIGIEVMASFFSPSWPARALRSAQPVNVEFMSFADKPWMVEPFNTWGMRDRERTFDRPPRAGFRTVFVGDSFLEHMPTSRSLPAAVEELFRRVGQEGTEAINLGISGTGPISYYYRLRDVALHLSPDELAVFFFSGNDFLRNGEGFGDGLLPPLIDESPGRSLVGRIMPRTNWLAVNRLRQSEFLKGNKSVVGEIETLLGIARGAPEKRVPLLVQHMRRHYFPDVPEGRLVEILSRGDSGFWSNFAARPRNEEYLMGWLLYLMIASELDEGPFTSIQTTQQAEDFISIPDINATLSWLVQMDRLARGHGVPLRLFVIPVGTVDPELVEFWKPWPRFYSWYLHCAVRHERLIDALRNTTVSFVDLQPIFQGVPGTYRKADGHWTGRGVDMAADRVYRELQRLRQGPAIARKANK